MNKPIRHYELTNHLGNILTVINDRVDATSKTPQIENSMAYEPFGRQISGLTFHRDAGKQYKFGFQNQENVKELFGGQASWFKYRISDNRLGRFFTIDPLASKYPHNSPYAFSENRVIDGVELEGKECYLLGMTQQSATLQLFGAGKEPSAGQLKQAAQTDLQVAQAHAIIMASAVGGVAVAEYAPAITSFLQNTLKVSVGSATAYSAKTGVDLISQLATNNGDPMELNIMSPVTNIFSNPYTSSTFSSAFEIKVNNIVDAYSKGEFSLIFKNTMFGKKQYKDIAIDGLIGGKAGKLGDEATAGFTKEAYKAPINFMFNSTTNVISNNAKSATDEKKK